MSRSVRYVQVSLEPVVFCVHYTVLAQDGDNYLDICLDLSYQPSVAEGDLLLSLHCDEEKVET